GGSESLASLIAEHGGLPATAEQMTGGGGRHFFFRYPGGSFPKTLAPGIDLKAAGGYVLLAPSIHASGNPYRWVNRADALLKPADPPSWLLECIALKLNGACAGRKGVGDE